MLEDITDQSVEIMCQMLHKICPHIVRRATRESQLVSESPEKRPKKTL